MVGAVGPFLGRDHLALPDELRITFGREVDQGSVEAVGEEDDGLHAGLLRKHVTDGDPNLDVVRLETVTPNRLAAGSVDQDELSAAAEQKVVAAVAAQIAPVDHPAGRGAAPAHVTLEVDKA